MKSLVTILAVVLFLFSGIAVALAATGTIDSINSFAWSDNGGWVNWYATNGNVTVTDTTLTGYIWSADFGWINLNPTDGGVTNNSGTLGGYAWGQNTGWISFLGVTIDSNGIFHGHTVAQNIFGTMTFDCDNCKVVTTWRTSSTSGNTGGTGGGGVISGPFAYEYQAPQNTTNTTAGQSSPSASTTNTMQTQQNTSKTSLTTLPPTLIPTSKPQTSPQPTTKPPSSSRSSAYTTQLIPSTHTFPTSTIPTTQHGNTVPLTVAPVTNTCSWFGACWWEGIVRFFASLF